MMLEQGTNMKKKGGYRRHEHNITFIVDVSSISPQLRVNLRRVSV